MHRYRSSRRIIRNAEPAQPLFGRLLDRIAPWIDPTQRDTWDTVRDIGAVLSSVAEGHKVDAAAVHKAGRAFSKIVYKQSSALAAALMLFMAELLPDGPNAEEQAYTDYVTEIMEVFGAGFLDASLRAASSAADATWPAAEHSPRDGDVTLFERTHEHQARPAHVATNAASIAATLADSIPVETMHALIMAIPDRLIRVRRDGSIVALKPARDDFIAPQHHAGQDLREVFPRGEAKQVLHLIHAALESGQVQVMEYSLVIDGREHDREARIVACGADEVLVLVRDTSARKRAEASLLQARLYESLSVLSAGIAHAFNNRLMAISGQAELARSEAPADSQVQTRMTQIERSVHGASELVKQMLAYGGGAVSPVEPIELACLLRELEPQLARLALRRAALRIEFEENVPAVAGDAEQLRQAILLLAANAFEAVDAGGEVRIGISRRANRAHEQTTPSLWPGPPDAEHVVLEVSDTGPGMDGVTRARMFEPFFTTKARGGGLSLAVVIGIVHSHGGAMEVDSERERGTSVRVLLPPVRPSPAAGVEQPPTG